MSETTLRTAYLRRDSMTAYVADRAPHLAPFDWFGARTGSAVAR